MTSKRLIMGAFIVITLITLAFATATPNCNDPENWATESGVAHCAVNGGK